MGGNADAGDQKVVNGSCACAVSLLGGVAIPVGEMTSLPNLRNNALVSWKEPGTLDAMER